MGAVEEQATAPAEEVAAASLTPETPTPAVMPQEAAVQPVNTAPAMIAPVIIKPGVSQNQQSTWLQRLAFSSMESSL